MIRCPQGWTYERRPDRVLLTVSQPDLIARFRYYERLRPLERVGDLLLRHATGFGVSSPTPLQALEAIVTDEGEYGAVVHLEGVRECGSVACSCSMAFIFGDDCYSCLEGISDSVHAPQLRSAIRNVALTEELRLGIRQRRYLFKPPSWEGLLIGEAIAHYFPKNYPLVDARISVFPAMPLARDRQPIVDLQRLLGEHILVSSPGSSSGFVIHQREPSVPFAASSGLTGTRWLYLGAWDAGRLVARDIILLRDDSYAYAVELSTDPEHRPLAVQQFERLVHSIQQLPGRATRHPNAETFSHWAD